MDQQRMDFMASFLHNCGVVTNVRLVTAEGDSKETHVLLLAGASPMMRQVRAPTTDSINALTTAPTAVLTTAPTTAPTTVPITAPTSVSITASPSVPTLVNLPTQDHTL